MQYGKANLSDNQYVKTKRIKFGKDRNEIICRVAPPIKSAAEKGIWGVYLKNHLGYVIPADESTGGKDRYVVFSCIEQKDFKTKAIRQPCYECDELAFQKKGLEVKREELTKQGLSPDQIKLQLGPIEDWTEKHYLDSKWNMLAKEPDGEWGFLQIPHKAREAMILCIKTLQTEEGIDALDPEQGVWFKIVRTDTWNTTVFTCTAVQEVTKDEKGRITSKLTKLAPLTADDEAQLDKLPELHTLERKFTPDQVRSIVQSHGDVEVLKAVYNSPANAGKNRVGEQSPAPVAKVEVPVVTAVQAAAGSASLKTGLKTPEDFLTEFGKKS